MAGALTKIVIQHDGGEIKQSMIDQLQLSSTSPAQSIERLAMYLRGVGAGVKNASLAVGIGAVQATATVVFTATQPTANDTVTINGVAFTAKSSGATGNQFNFGAASGAGAIASAAALAAAINASATAKIASVVTAANNGTATCTITMVQPGLVGMLGLMAISMTGTTKTDFASGAEGTTFALSCGV